MDKRKKSKVVMDNFKETVKEEFASIAEEVPIFGSVVSKIVKIGQTTAQKAQKEMEEAERERPPKYISSVNFCCKKGHELTEDEKYEIVNILDQDFLSSDKESLAHIEEFIDEYIGGEIHTEFTEDFIMGKDFIWIHLLEGVRFFYDDKAKKCIDNVMAALNALLRAEIFDRYEAFGQSID